MQVNVPRWMAWSCVLLALLFLAWTEGAAHQQDALIFQNADEVLARHGAYTRLQDSLLGVERRFVGEEAFWRAKADSIAATFQNVSVGRSSHADSSNLNRSSNDSTFASKSGDSLQVIFLGRALDACDASRGAADSALVRCAARGDSLSASLTVVLRAKECRLPLGIRCPSRGLIAGVSVIAGLWLGSKLH